jgi:hypothetical protein
MKGIKSRRPKAKARAQPKPNSPSPSELSEDQLEQVAGGGGFPAVYQAAPTTGTPGTGNLNELERLGQTFRKIEYAPSTGVVGTDDWEG